MSEPTGIRRLLAEAAGRWGIDHPVETARLFSSWDDIVGAEIASRCQPLSLRAGTLKVRTQSAAWASELKYLAPQILRRLNAELGRQMVTQVKVSVGPPE